MSATEASPSDAGELTYGQRRLRGSKPHKQRPPACTHKRVTLSSAQLPLCCPLDSERVWDAHPRVYLVLDEEHPEAICPYCETHYELLPDTLERT